MGENHVNLNHTRGDRQKKVMERIQNDGVCPFCREHLAKYHTKPIIQEGVWWILTENFEPYDGAKIHLLAICTEHVESIEELPGEAYAELLKLFSEFTRKNKIPGGTILLRFGDTDMTGATVSHLHAQLIVGCSRKNSEEKIRTKIGYKYPK